MRIFFIFFQLYKRASASGVALFLCLFLFISLGWARSGPEEVIREAESFILKNQREKAAQLLMEHINQKSPQAPALKSKLRELSALFFSEKAHRIFQVAESTYYLEGSDSRKQYYEALSSEDSNILILKSLIRSELHFGECQKASELIQQGQKINPFHEEIRTLILALNLCGEEVQSQKPFLSENSSAESKLFLAIYLWKSKNKRDLAFQKFKELSTQFLDYPEPIYWEWAVKVERNERALEEAKKYLSICHKIDYDLRHKYKNDPYLCKKTKALEKYVQDHQKDVS